MLNERYTSANSARIASSKCVGLMASSLLLSIPALGHAEMGFASESYQDSDGGRFEHVLSREFETGAAPFMPENVRFESGEGSSEVLGAESVVYVSGVPMTLVASIDPSGPVGIELTGDDGSHVNIDLSESRFRVETRLEGGRLLQHDWSRPRGDMFSLLESVGSSPPRGDLGTVFDDMPLFYAAMDHTEAALGGVAATPLQMVRIAASLLSTSVEALQESDEPTPSERTKGGVEPVPIDPVTPGRDCDIADQDISESGKMTVEVPGVSVVVVAAQTNLNADCITDNCITGGASISRSIRAQEGNGAGCPDPWYQWGTYSYEADIEFSAESGTGECTNGIFDTAKSGSVHVSGGGFSVEIVAASDMGNGLSAEAGVEGHIKVCMDADPLFDDITDVIVTGLAEAKVQ